MALTTCDAALQESEPPVVSHDTDRTAPMAAAKINACKWIIVVYVYG